MATIQLVPDNVNSHIWWMKWIERDERIGSVVRDTDGRCQIVPSGPHWSPMKSFAGLSFDQPEAALAEVRLYFLGR